VILATGCLGERSLDGEAVRAALTAVGLDKVLLSVREDSPAAGLSGLPACGVRTGWEELPRALAAAKEARCTRVVLDLPVDWELATACRAVFDVGRGCGLAGVEPAVLTPAMGPLADPGQIQLLLEDLASQGVRYWHVPSRCHLGELGDEVWLNLLDRYMAGMSLDDVSGDEAGLSPGLGEIDFGALAAWKGRAMDVVLDVDPVPDVAMLRMTVASLADAGFR
jgi:hypothetical protein